MTKSTLKPGDGRETPIGPLSKKAARKRAKRAPVTTRNNLPKRAADLAKQSSPRPRTREDIANEETAEQLALRIWAAVVAQNALSAMSALIFQGHGLHVEPVSPEEKAEAAAFIEGEPK